MVNATLRLTAAAVAFGPALLLAQNSAVTRAIEFSLAHFRSNAVRYGISHPDRDLRVRSARAQRDAAHVRFDQYFNGVPVFEGEAISHVDAAGNTTVTSALRGGLSLNTTPAVDVNDAIAGVAAAVGATGPYQTPAAVLKILPRGERSSTDRLVWHVRIFTENNGTRPAQWDYFVDAHTGAVVWRFDSLETASATATGRTMYAGDVPLSVELTDRYYLADLTRGNGIFTTDLQQAQGGSGTVFRSTTSIFGNGLKDNSDRATAGADAHFGMMLTLDYYLSSFSRNGIDNNGRRTFSRVHYGFRYENAFWSDSCFCMSYGDGFQTFYPLTSIDVAGHEMSHGVMSTEANLTYSGESGGLNESNSDIFGTLVEFFANNAQDPPEYWIGERIMRSNWTNGGMTYTQNNALRYMDDPHRDGSSPACWFQGIGGLNVHYSSGPANHMFYLLAEGGTSKCNGNQVSGIGRTDAARIWYKAITDFMISSTNYRGARMAALRAAVALFGAGSPQVMAVNSAFAAINVTAP